MNKPWPIKIRTQPSETTCGPTCLQSLYDFYGDSIELPRLVTEIPYVAGGGTLGVLLGTHALLKGYQVRVYSHNLHVLDPTWFSLPREELIVRLSAQLEAKKSKKTLAATKAYMAFIESGGEVAFEDLTAEFLEERLSEDGPILCGLSATYLYRSARELNEDNSYDDVRGVPQGHFVILSGISKDLKTVTLHDPLDQSPLHQGNCYEVATARFINAVLVGVITYDANLIVIKRRV